MLHLYPEMFNLSWKEIVYLLPEYENFIFKNNEVKPKWLLNYSSTSGLNEHNRRLQEQLPEKIDESKLPKRPTFKISKTLSSLCVESAKDWTVKLDTQLLNLDVVKKELEAAILQLYFTWKKYNNYSKMLLHGKVSEEDKVLLNLFYF